MATAIQELAKACPREKRGTHCLAYGNKSKIGDYCPSCNRTKRVIKKFNIFGA